MQTLHTATVGIYILLDRDAQEIITTSRKQISPCAVSLQIHKPFQENARQAPHWKPHMCYHIQEDKAFCRALYVMTCKKQMQTFTIIDRASVDTKTL